MESFERLHGRQCGDEALATRLSGKSKVTQRKPTSKRAGAPKKIGLATTVAINMRMLELLWLGVPG